MKTISLKTGKVMKTMVATLIILASFSVITKGNGSSKGAIEVSENGLALQVKSWMSNNEYWDETANNQDNEELLIDSARNGQSSDAKDESQELLANQIKSWINNNSYWNSEADREEPELALQMKSWMKNNAYWSDDTNTNEQELALQIESWMNDSAYWSQSEEQIISDNVLANY